MSRKSEESPPKLRLGGSIGLAAPEPRLDWAGAVAHGTGLLSSIDVVMERVRPSAVDDAEGEIAKFAEVRVPAAEGQIRLEEMLVTFRTSPSTLLFALRTNQFCRPSATTRRSVAWDKTELLDFLNRDYLRSIGAAKFIPNERMYSRATLEILEKLTPEEKLAIAAIDDAMDAAGSLSSAGTLVTHIFNRIANLIIERLPEAKRLAPPRLLWRDRKTDPVLARATPPEFIRAVYVDRLGKGFTQADLGKLDIGAYRALHQWLHRPDPTTGERNRLPDDLDLPTLEDWNESRLRAYGLNVLMQSEDGRRLLKIAMGRAARTPA